MQNKLSLGKVPLPLLRKRAFLRFVLYYNTEQPTSAWQAGIRGSVGLRTRGQPPPSLHKIHFSSNQPFKPLPEYPFPPPLSKSKLLSRVGRQLEGKGVRVQQFRPLFSCPPPKRVPSVLGALLRPVSKRLADAAFGASSSPSPPPPLPTFNSSRAVWRVPSVCLLPGARLRRVTFPGRRFSRVFKGRASRMKAGRLPI